MAAGTPLDASARGDWREAWVWRGFAGFAMTIAAMFWLPELASPRGRRRLGAVLLLGVGASVASCGVGWPGARLALLLAGA